MAAENQGTALAALTWNKQGQERQRTSDSEDPEEQRMTSAHTK